MARIESVAIPSDTSTARFVLHNTITQRISDSLFQDKDNFVYCDCEVAAADIIDANMLAKKTPFYRSKRELYENMTDWYDYQEEQLVKYAVNSYEKEQPLPLISEYDRKRKERRVSPVTPFYKKLRRAVTKIGRILKRHDLSGLGEKLSDFVRNFYNIAKSLSLGRKIWPGFIFGFSHTKFCERLGLTKTALNRILNLAAGLGLITKITPAEAKGIGEFWHKKYGVGMLQFKLVELNLKEIEARWLLWLQSGTKLHDVTLGKIKAVLGVDIETHPEVKDKELRKLIKEANEKVTLEKEQQDRDLMKYNRIVHYDPFNLGHKQYYHDIKRQYTPDEARTILKDIINNHNERCRLQWYSNDQDPLLQEDTVVFYKVRAAGKTRFLYKKYSDLPEGLLISEYQWRTARNYAAKVISDLYEQGLVAVITETRDRDNIIVSHKFKDFLDQVWMMKESAKENPKIASTVLWNNERKDISGLEEEEEEEDLKLIISDIFSDKPAEQEELTLSDIIKIILRGKPNAP